MSDMEISKVITQMRALASQLELPAAVPPPASAPGSPQFSDVLLRAVNSVSEQQETATGMIRSFELGTGEASVAEVMVAMQKASLSFEAVTQVRNRLVEAYRDIMNMPI
jgi:flagellar hook-basal body complex protein FliE